MLKDIDVGVVVGGKYKLQRLLGTGAMGQVWTARHEALGQLFAIKLMVPLQGSQIQELEGEATSLKRFENEAQIAAALSRKSRHIASVTDYGIDDGTPYIVMELLDGQGLEKRFESGRLPYYDAAQIIGQIAKGLTVAHAEGVTHRDLKPANIFLTRSEDGELVVKLLDFGIARMARRIVNPSPNRAPTRLTVKGVVLGSPAYMSPEQAMAESPDLRADVWSLAVLAYESLAGTAPFEATTLDDTILRICNFNPTPLRAFVPDASDALVAVFTRAFSPSLAKRFQTAPEFALALERALGERANVTAPTPTSAMVATAQIHVPRSNVLPIVAIAAVVALVVAGSFVVPKMFSAPQPDRSSAALPSPSASTAPSVQIGMPGAIVVAPPSAATIPTRIQVISPTTTHATPSAAPIAAPTQTAAPSKSIDRSAVF